MITPVARGRFLSAVLACLLPSVSGPRAAAAETAGGAVLRTFDVPAGPAAAAFKRFIAQSQVQLLFVADEIAGVETPALRGRFTAREGIDRLLRDTPLAAVQTANGSIAVRRAAVPNVPRAAPAPAVGRPASVPAGAAAAILLTPFEVSTDRDLGYASGTTVSGTRTNEELKNVPASISILNRQFLDDIAAVDMFKAVEFSLGAENTNQGGAGVKGDGGSGNSVVFRGIQNDWQSRDGFQWYVPSDTFNVERVEANRGPTGQLYGDAAATGILNISSKQARLGRNSVRLDLRVDDLSSRRFTLDANRQLTPRHAVRFNLLGSDLRDWQDTAFDRRWGYAAAGTHKFFDGRTSLRLNAELGEINRVQGTPLQLDFHGAYTPGTGSTADLDPALAGLQSPAGTQLIMPAGNTQRWTLVGGRLHNLESTGAPAGGAGRYYRQSVAVPGPAVPVADSVSPRHRQWNGPSNRADRDYHTVTATLDHRFSPAFYAELAYNNQTQRGTNTNAATFGNVRRDVNPSLPAPTGTGEIANPYFDELYVEHIFRRQAYTNRVHNLRATAVHDLPPPAAVARWIGPQRIVGTVAHRQDRFALVNSEEDLTAAAIAAGGQTGPAARFANNAVVRRHYLRDGNGERLRLTALPESAFVSSTPANTQAARPRLESYSLNVFGALLEGRVRTSLGVRRDFFDQALGAISIDPATGLVDFIRDRDGSIAFTPSASLANTAWNFGAVWHAHPSVSLFVNYAETFQFNNSGTYFNGDTLLPRLGDGTDYGVRLTLWRERLSLVATFFDNTALNGTLNGTTQPVADEINALLDPVGRRYVAGRDTLDTNSRGYELELVANPLPHWTVRAGWSFYDRKDEAFAPRLRAVLAQMQARAASPALYALTEAQLAALIRENPRTRKLPNLATRWNFRTGPLRGCFVGGSGFWREVSLPGRAARGYVMANLLAGYGRRVGPVRWSLQLNVDNLLDRRLRLTALPAVSYLAPRVFVVTNSLEF